MYVFDSNGVVNLILVKKIIPVQIMWFWLENFSLLFSYLLYSFMKNEENKVSRKNNFLNYSHFNILNYLSSVIKAVN